MWKHATQLIPFLRDLPYSERLTHLAFAYHLCTIEEDEVTWYYDIQITPWYVGCWCIYSSRGHNLKLCKPRACTNVRLDSFSNRVINDRNNLTANVVNAHSLSCFKNLMDKRWTDSQYERNVRFVTRIHRLCLFSVNLILILVLSNKAVSGKFKLQ